MKYKVITTSALIGLLSVSLVACGGTSGTAAEPTAAAAPAIATPMPTAIEPTSLLSDTISLGVSGSGEIMANQDADLVFSVQGTVAEVKVKEGDSVKKGDLLAILDTRPFDQALHQAEAGLASAKAQESSLHEPAKATDAAAARAQLQQAQAAYQQLKDGPKTQDLQNADAAVALAETNVQSAKDQLSLVKTQAEHQLEVAVQTLTQAQAAYSEAKNNWDRVQDKGTNPSNPKTCDTSGCKPNKLNDSQREVYYTAYVQAESAMKQAETNVQAATVQAEQARKNEVTGIQAAEEQLKQTRAASDKLRLPPDQADVAAAQAAIAQARAAQAKLVPDPTDSQQAIAQSGVAQAEASLELAKLNREHAELRAPFDGIIATINIDPGDPSSSGSSPAMQIVDISQLRAEVQISDVDIGRLQVGQAAQIYVDSVPDTVFKGKISYIAPTATIVGTIRTYLVRVALEGQKGLRAGMSARVDFDTK